VFSLLLVRGGLITAYINQSP